MVTCIKIVLRAHQKLQSNESIAKQISDRVDCIIKEKLPYSDYLNILNPVIFSDQPL